MTRKITILALVLLALAAVCFECGLGVAAWSLLILGLLAVWFGPQIIKD